MLRTGRCHTSGLTRRPSKQGGTDRPTTTRGAGSPATDLLPRLGERGLTEGQAPLRADLRRHFDALLRDYSLFGGRADEIAAVSAFLADPQGGYLFLTGPSGYGKTALLVQLARQGEAAYHFLSRTYGTADEDLFLRNLCQQLAARHGLGGRLPASTAELRALYPDLLRLPPADGRPVVVLLDGLDEAVNWEIRPAAISRPTCPMASK